MIGKDNFIKNEEGFTLIEMLVSLAVFVFLAFAVIAVYISFNSSQIRTTVSQQLLNDSQYAIELMAREIRNNTIVDYSPTCSTYIDTGDVNDIFVSCVILEREDGQVFAFTSYRNQISLDTSVKLLYILLTCDDTYSNCNPIDLSSNATIEILSSQLNNINIENLDFYILPSSDPFVGGGPDQQPRVTINLVTSYLSDNKFEKIENVFQTTVSSRVYRR